MEALIKLADVSKSYFNSSGISEKVLNSVNLDIIQGESIAIIGPSGSGKSTLLNIAGCLDSPDSGNIFYKDIPLNNLNALKKAEFRLNVIGFIFQEHHLLPHCSVLENILLPAMPKNANARLGNPVEKALELIKRFKLAHRMNHFPSQLSGGEKQRAAVIRALINSPDLILADEPTGSLDRENALMVADMLCEINTQFKTALLLVTHSGQIAQKMSKIYELADGNLHINHLDP